MQDRKAWRQIKQNQEAGFEYLFNKYYDPLCVFAEIYLKSPDIASDAVSDVFIKLWNQRHRITINSSVRAFIFRSVKNACLNSIRDQKKGMQDYEDFADILVSADLSPQETIEFRELQQEVDAITQELPERRRLVLTLKLEAGLSNKEIADTLNISENTVKNQLGHAINRLREKLRIRF